MNESVSLLEDDRNQIITTGGNREEIRHNGVSNLFACYFCLLFTLEVVCGFPLEAGLMGSLLI